MPRPTSPLTEEEEARKPEGLPSPTIMGILNVTPDSFSDGGRYLEPAAAVAHGLALAEAGADLIDVGGESTRPGATPVAQDEELRRVVPVIERLAEAGLSAAISIDTSKAAVARAALDAGASYVNDVTAFRADPALAELVAARRVDCCLMHMLGEPRTMQREPRYVDVVGDVRAFLEERVEFALAAGIERERITIDPGIGFGKTPTHNLTLLARLGELTTLGLPILVGTSRKSFLGVITGRTEPERLASTIATCVMAFERGARVFRVHDVAPVRDALAVAAATVNGRWTTTPTTISTTPRS
jgi:dihydropteroate synthase